MDNSLTTQQLLVRRRITRALAEHLSRQLQSHLSTLVPLFTPRSVFGGHVRGAAGSASKAADEALQQLSNEYEAMHQSTPFNLRARFDTPIEIMSATPVIVPKEYDHQIGSGPQAKQIRVVSPCQWIVSYDGFGPEQLRSLIARSGSAADSQLQQCVLHHLALFVGLSRRQGVCKLLDSLRFPVSFECHDEFGKLPLVVVHGPLSTFLPSDDVVLESTELSGAPRFEEIIDLEKVGTLVDSFKEQVLSVIREHGDADVQSRFNG